MYCWDQIIETVLFSQYQALLQVVVLVHRIISVSVTRQKKHFFLVLKSTRKTNTDTSTTTCTCTCRQGNVRVQVRKFIILIQ